MPASLVESQFAALEEPLPEEAAITVDAQLGKGKAAHVMIEAHAGKGAQRKGLGCCQKGHS